MAVISYFGGKSSSAFQELINTKIPKTGIKTYLEPFSGSMGTYMDDDNLKFDVVKHKFRDLANMGLLSYDLTQFLREKIYPLVINNSFIHDSYQSYNHNSKQFPSERINKEFIGDVFDENEIRHPEYYLQIN